MIRPESGVAGAGFRMIGAPAAMAWGDLVGAQVEGEVEGRDAEDDCFGSGG